MTTTEPITARPERQAIHGYVTHEAHLSWHDFAAEHGVSVSGLLEALGPMLLDSPHVDPDATWRTEVAKAVRIAQRVDVANRRRRR
jgi:hypothetical protein